MPDLAPPRVGRAGEEATTTTHGVLETTADDFTLARVAPSSALAKVLERHWRVRWDLGGRVSSVSLLPHPCVNLVLDRGRLLVAGVGREVFTYPLTGAGQVLGTKFRPGAFFPYAGRPVSEFTGRTLPAADLWPEAGALEESLRGASLRQFVEAVESLLARIRGDRGSDPNVALVGDIVRALLQDRHIQRVDQVAERLGMSARSLQRLFHRYVGVSPKFVLTRYRLHEAAARLADGTRTPWAEVAVELGYFDQSHFIRDFVGAVGVTPAQYAAACAEGRLPISA